MSLKMKIFIVYKQYYPGSDCADGQADLRLCYSHMAKTGFLMTWLNYEYYCVTEICTCI